MNGSAGFESGNDAQSLQDWLDGQRARPEWPVLRGIIASLLNALEKVDADSGLEGGISPRTVHLVSATPPRVEIVPAEPLASMLNPDHEAVAYVAPEMRDGGAPTPASDMFGLAAVVYRIVTGRAPEVICGDRRPANHMMASHLAADDYPPDFLSALGATLATVPGERLAISAWRTRALLASFAEVASAEDLAGEADPHGAAPLQSTSGKALRRLNRSDGAALKRLLWGF